MVCSSTAPLLLLDGECHVIAASISFCDAFDIEPATTAGRQLFALGAGEWDEPQLRSLANATVSGDASISSYEMDLKRAGRPTRRLVLNLQKLAYGDTAHTRLLLAVADVTQARAKAKADGEQIRENEARSEALQRDNAILLQEVRHRIANSLQIIASIMMHDARRTQSEETRGRLRDAHARVLSIAELQQQLAVSTLGTARPSRARHVDCVAVQRADAN